MQIRSLSSRTNAQRAEGSVVAPSDTQKPKATLSSGFALVRDDASLTKAKIFAARRDPGCPRWLSYLVRCLRYVPLQPTTPPHLRGIHKMQRKHVLGLALSAAALASIGVFAQRGALNEADVEIIEAVSPDMPARGAQQRLSAKASDFSATKKKDVSAASSDPTVEDVADVDSFKREVVFLGLASAFVTLENGCPPPDPAFPEQVCQEINPTPGGLTAFSYSDLDHITLPGKSANSLLCYWFSPVISVNYSNPTATRVNGLLRYSPTLTVENPVLDDPALIDPTTGVAFGGQLLTSMTSSEILQVPLEPGAAFAERTRDSTVCMAGLLSKRALVDTYGLTEAQAKEFFKKPTTIRLNVTGSARYIDFAGMTFGLRIVGDKR